MLSTPEGQDVRGRSVQLGMAYAGGFKSLPLHCLGAEGNETVARWGGPRINLGCAFESADMQRGRQVKHTAASRGLGT